MIESDLTTLKQNPDLVRLNPELQPVKDAPKGAKRSKYGNILTTYNGRTYHSKKEAARAQELDLMLKAGEIIAWFPQVPIALKDGSKYIADFIVIFPSGSPCGGDWYVRVEDVKGYRTREYKHKRKLYRETYGREIVEI
jgi:hypothetical protein